MTKRYQHCRGKRRGGRKDVVRLIEVRNFAITVGAMHSFVANRWLEDRDVAGAASAGVAGAASAGVGGVATEVAAEGAAVAVGGLASAGAPDAQDVPEGRIEVEAVGRSAAYQQEQDYYNRQYPYQANWLGKYPTMRSGNCPVQVTKLNQATRSQRISKSAS
jgi:hypothetical protein